MLIICYIFRKKFNVNRLKSKTINTNERSPRQEQGIRGRGLEKL